MAGMLEASIQEDVLIRGLIAAKGKQVEIIAFGIAYSGTLKEIDVKAGCIALHDGDDQAVLEFERIESFRAIE